METVPISDRSAKDKQRRGCHEPRIEPESGPLSAQFVECHGSGGRPNQEDAEHEPEITQAIGEKALLAAAGGAGR